MGTTRLYVKADSTYVRLLVIFLRICRVVLQRGMDILDLKIYDVLEYNLPYVQSDFSCNLGPTL